MKSVIIYTHALLFAACISTVSPSAFAADTFSITDEIFVKDPPRFGMNFRDGPTVAWATGTKANDWLCWGSFEPINMTYYGIATDGSQTTLVHEGRGGGLSYWNSMHDGFFDGGVCSVYRIEDGDMRLVRTAGIKTFRAGPDEESENTVTFTGSGEAVQSGDLYVLRKKLDYFPLDRMHERFSKGHVGKVVGGAMTKHNDRDMKAVIDESTAAPEGGSTASLRMHITEAESWKPVGLSQPFVIGDPSRIQLQRGEDYRFQAWLKQEGMEEGLVKIQIGPFFETEVEVTGEWQKFEFEFPSTTRVEWGKRTLAQALETPGFDPQTLELLRAWSERLANNFSEVTQGPPSLISEVAARGGEVAYYHELLAELRERAAVLVPNARETGIDWIIEKAPKSAARIDDFAKQVNALGDRVVHEGRMKDAAKKAAGALSELEKKIRETFYDREMEALRDQLRPLLAAHPEVAERFARAEATPLLPRDFSNDSLFILGATGNGTLWVDNLGIFQKGSEPFEVLPVWRQALREFKPGVLRLWAGLYHKGMKAWMQDGWQKQANAYPMGVRTPGHLSLRRELEISEDVVADPWLVAWPINPDEEMEAFMEYLAAPADVGYGRLRAQHGRARPWTEAFETIYIEAGNEMWNTMMPINFGGRPDIVARISDHFFRQIKSSPYYDPEQFKLIVNGFGLSTKPDGWSHNIARYIEEADYIDYAHYYGGWDGFTPIGQNDEDLFSRQMLYCPHVVENQMIHSMNMDKDLPGKLGTIFTDQPGLRERFLSVMEAETDQKNLPRAEGPGNDIRDTLGNLMTNDPELRSAIGGSLNLWNRDLQQLGVRAVIEASRKDPNLQKMLAEIFGLTPEQAMLVVPAAVGHNTHARIALARTLHKHPEIGARMLALFEGPWKNDNPKHQPLLIDEVKRSMQGDFKIHYWMINAFRGNVIPAIVEQIKANPEVAAAVPNYLSSSWASEQARDLNGRVQQMIDRMSVRFTDMVRNNMLEDPAFAEAVFAEMKQGSENFLVAPVGEIMPVVREEIYERFRPETLLNTQEKPNSKSMALLPENVRRGIAAKIKAATERDPSPFYPLVAELTQASLASIEGDGAPLEAVLASPALQERVAQAAAYGLGYDLLEPMLDDAALARRFQYFYNELPRDRVLGRAVYESGPGYQLPGPGKESPPQDERMGKSMAIGIVTLDTFLYNQSLDFGPQAYYEMKSGDYWSTHNNMNEMIPYPSFLVLQMRNRYCEGDLIYVDYKDVKTIDIPEQEVFKTSTSGKKTSHVAPGRNNIPLANCYAYRDGDRYSFILYNRSFTEPRPVTLTLPYRPESRVEIYKMVTDNPREGNRYEEKIRIEEEVRNDFRNGYTLSLPPGSAWVLINRSSK